MLCANTAAFPASPNGCTFGTLDVVVTKSVPHVQEKVVVFTVE